MKNFSKAIYLFFAIWMIVNVSFVSSLAVIILFGEFIHHGMRTLYRFQISLDFIVLTHLTQMFHAMFEKKLPILISILL